MEMHQVRYFLAVARTLNFTRAAEESNVTQPSLTRAIQKLEEEFGGLLFRRERSLTHLTDLGRMMVPHLERTFDAAQAAKSLAKGLGKAAVAPLSLGVGTALHGAHFHESIAEVGEGLPGFQLRILNGNTDTLLADMLKGEVDIVILAELRTMHDRLDLVGLFQQSYVAAARADHPLAAIEAPAFSDLANVAWIEGAGDLHAEFREHCAAAAVEPDFRHSAPGDRELVQLVQAGMGCAVVAHEDPFHDGLRPIEIAGMRLTRQIVLATVSGRKRSAAADALIRSMKARLWRRAA